MASVSNTNGFINWGDIKGGSKDDKHKDWSEISGFSHGLSQQFSGSRSNEGGAYQSAVNHEPFTITKPMDSASPKLYEALHNGTPIPKVVVELTRAAGKSPIVYQRYTMTNVALSNIHTAADTSGDSNSFPSEVIGMTYTTMQWEYTKQDDTGAAKGTVATKVDLAKGAGAS
jgi:type VI secretion system Hcp family effector